MWHRGQSAGTSSGEGFVDNLVFGGMEGGSGWVGWSECGVECEVGCIDRGEKRDLKRQK